MSEKRYVEVNEFENELLRITCPKCGYPMRVLARDENNIYQCYCASCQTDRFMKDTFDREILTVEKFKRDINRGKGIDGEDLFDLVYELDKENNKFKHHIKKLEKELHLAHMRSMFSTVKSFNGDVSKRYYYSEETDRVYDSANHYGQYDKILDKKEIAMLLNEYETMLNGDVE